MTNSSHAITGLDSGADVVKHHRGKKKAPVLNDMFGKATISVMLLLQNLYYCAKRIETFR